MGNRAGEHRRTFFFPQNPGNFKGGEVSPLIPALPPQRPRLRAPSGRAQTPQGQIRTAYLTPHPGLAFFIVFLGSFVFCRCGTGPYSRETPLPAQLPVPVEIVPARPGGIAEEIRSLVEIGSPPSLDNALTKIKDRDLGVTEFGRIMNAVAAALYTTVYPAIQIQLPSLDPPRTHTYSRILLDAEKGHYTKPPANSHDCLVFILPILAFLRETGQKAPEEALHSALEDLKKAGELNPSTVLAPLFSALIMERLGRAEEALPFFARAYQLSPECYPAALGLALGFSARGQKEEALVFLRDLSARFPANMVIKRQLALIYYQNGEWAQAEPAIKDILQRESRNNEFILMLARVLVEQGQYSQAQVPLDNYASIDGNNRLYLFLRARLQAEGLRSRETALHYLRLLLKQHPEDEEAAVYAARLLIESNKNEEQAEGRGMLTQFLREENPSLQVLSLALQDALRREAWREGRPYMNRLLAERRSVEDLLSAFRLERGQGNHAAALTYAQEAYEKDPAHEEGLIAYISALIDNKHTQEAGRMIETRLNGMEGGSLKSRYYYLRSRLKPNEETAMGDLRASLFEDPRNLNALTAMFEIYHHRHDERRAVYYLKQALAMAPENPKLKRYQTEYASALKDQGPGSS